MADPNPVRRVEGAAPRQNDRMRLGELEISRIAASKDVWPDCCTRVLRRSAGCRRAAVKTPDPKPARKWNAGRSSVDGLNTRRGSYKTTIFWLVRHLTFRPLFKLAFRKEIEGRPVLASVLFLIETVSCTCLVMEAGWTRIRPARISQPDRGRAAPDVIPADGSTSTRSGIAHPAEAASRGRITP
jgi:hypothetical protein